MELTTVRNIAAGAAALASLPGSIELGVLTAAGLLPCRPRSSRANLQSVRLAVVIPAHNERENIGRCLDSLLADQRAEGCAIVVVADNCTDETAAIARQRGVEVIERFSAEQRGKGYALEFAFERLAYRGFYAYVIVDADTVVPRGFHAAFSHAFSQGADAAQCAYLALDSAGDRRARLLDLALRGFNLLRPLGRSRLGLSAGILGNGFALRRELLERVPYTAHSVVEDLEYHLTLVEREWRVEFVESTFVRASMPCAGRGRETQRARWEGGRFRMLREYGMQLTGKLLAGRVTLLEPLFDLLLFPLGFHALLLLAALFGAAAWIEAVGVAGLAILLFHVACAAWRGSSVWRDLRALFSAPAYVLWKLAKLPAILAASTRRAAWVRTERTAARAEVN